MGIRPYLRLGLLALLPWLVPGGAGAWTFGPGPGGYPAQQPQQAPPGDFNFRPMPPSNARGIPPGYPGAPPQAQASAPPTQIQPPRLEMELSDSRPYLQENVLLTLRVVSGRNIRTMDPQLPQNEGLVFNLIKGPTALSRASGQGQTEILNEMKYLVTPMRVGSLELSRINVQVEAEGSLAQTLTAPQSLRMEVRPADARVNPWLPLEQLTLTSNINASVDTQPGQPVALILKLSAAGATGAQLPSMEAMLKSPDFRVYREKTETEGGLSQNGRHILGTRTEHYTLVPQMGGTLHLPAARIAWFNVNTGTLEHTTLPIKTLETNGSGGGLGQVFSGALPGGPFPGGHAWVFWGPLLGVLLLLSGYWVGAWYQGRRSGARRIVAFPKLGALLRPLRARWRRRASQRWGRWRPASYWSRAMARLARWLPTSIRFWFWVRCVESESDPEIWAKTLKFMSHRELALSPYATLPQMAERVVRYQPLADPERVRTLFRQLDGAMYGHQPLDFMAWKRDFRRQVRLGVRLWGRRRLVEPVSSGGLPALNPRGGVQGA